MRKAGLEVDHRFGRHFVDRLAVHGRALVHAAPLPLIVAHALKARAVAAGSFTTAGGLGRSSKCPRVRKLVVSSSAWRTLPHAPSAMNSEIGCGIFQHFRSHSESTM